MEYGQIQADNGTGITTLRAEAEYVRLPWRRINEQKAVLHTAGNIAVLVRQNNTFDSYDLAAQAFILKRRAFQIVPATPLFPPPDNTRVEASDLNEDKLAVGANGFVLVLNIFSGIPIQTFRTSICPISSITLLQGKCVVNSLQSPFREELM